MPDWEKEEDYAFTEKLTFEEWAWEFLRRNSDYKKNYEYVVNIQNKDNANYGKIINPLITEVPHTMFYEPPKNKNESVKNWKLRCISEGKIPKQYSISVWYGKKWGITAMTDPISNNPPAFISPRPYPKLLDWESVENYYECSDEPYAPTQQKEQFSVIVFDLSQPITYQINTAKELLNEQQKKYLEHNKKSDNSTKHHTGKWKNYLRVLDAIALNVQLKDVSKIVFPHILNDETSEWLGGTKVNDHYNQGKKIVESNYIQILNKKK